MTTSTWNSTLLRDPKLAGARARLQARASRLIARWCAAHFTRPLHHRLGAFDLARSGLARQLLHYQRD
jgi:hypothetical protein